MLIRHLYCENFSVAFASIIQPPELLDGVGISSANFAVNLKAYHPLFRKSLYKNHLNSGTLGPSFNISVGTSLISSFIPSFLSLRLLSSTINILNEAAINAPVAPKAAVVANAGV